MLSIREAFPEDEGENACEAANSMGTTTRTKCEPKIKREYLPFAVEIRICHSASVIIVSLPNFTAVTAGGGAAKGRATNLRAIRRLQYTWKTAIEWCFRCALSAPIYSVVVGSHNGKEIKPSKDFEYANEAKPYTNWRWPRHSKKILVRIIARP